MKGYFAFHLPLLTQLVIDVLYFQAGETEG